MINEGTMDIVSRYNELVYHEFKVHWDFLKGKGGCCSQDQSSCGT